MDDKQTKTDRATGAALIERMRGGKNEIRIVRWPGATDPDAQVALVPLSIAENDLALSAAYKRFAALGMEMTPYTADDFNSELGLQLLAIAIRDPGEPARRMFPDVNELRELVRSGERSALMTEYLSLQQEVDPDLSAIGEDQFGHMRDLVKKKDVANLGVFASSTLAAFIIATADQSAS